jgi:hypothetical protein
VTPSTAVSPSAERLLGAARALACFRAELVRRAADLRFDDAPLERPFDARAFEVDLEEPDDAPRRCDVSAWAMLSSLCWESVPGSATPGAIGVILRP